MVTTSWTNLAAETWDDLGGDEVQDDIAWFRALLAGRGGRALDVGCGTGRLLVRFLVDGLDVDGVDTSADMLDLCRVKARRAGHEPRLYEQAMEALDLPGRYDTIFVPCGTFMLLLDDSSALATLRRFREHLAPGGLVALNLFGPFAAPELELGRWQRRAEATRADGSRVTMDVVTDRHDPATRVIEARRRYTVTPPDGPAREQLLVDRYRWSSPEDVARLLAEAGYGEHAALGGYTDEPFAPGHHTLVIQASV